MSQYINRSVSIVHRLKNSFFDKNLSVYRIGCGQQFFLMHIGAHPGITLQELAAVGYYDKATATRAVQKLECEGYVKAVTDETDKRVRHLFITDKSGAILEAAWKVSEDWLRIVTAGFTEDEIRQSDYLLGKMADNAKAYMGKFREDKE